MGPPQVKLNEKKAPADGFMDPLPEKKDEMDSPPVIVTVDRCRRRNTNCYMTAEQRRRQKRCRIACCTSLVFILLLLLGLGTAFLVYRMKHKTFWTARCGTQDGDQVPENVKVNHENQLITVTPQQPHPMAMEILHEYNRQMIAFLNSTSGTCYIDRLEETFAEGYARWQGYENTEHVQGRTLRVMPQPIQIEVVKHFAGVHIFAHCGAESVEYYWAMEVTEMEVETHPNDKYITV